MNSAARDPSMRTFYRRHQRVVGYLTVVLVAALAFALEGCCRKHPSETFPMPRSPDRACDTGGQGGYDVWIWKCVGEKRVVVYRLRGEWGCNPPQKETSSCGKKTPFEKKHVSGLARCNAIPAQFRWPR